jgi:NADH-quinone oxidoreductase subunit D
MSTTTNTERDPYATSAADQAAAEGATVFTAGGGDWDSLADEASSLHEERVVVNMGPQHPSTHGVLRLILELDGETVTEARAGIGYLHTGIEKNMEFRTWTQGVTFCTRMDYLTPMFQETAYCLAVERLLGITDQVPERASIIRVLMMELTRISSHMVCLGTGGMEMGATTVMTVGFRERERVLKVIEGVTGLRMNNAFIRPGGVAQDMTDELVALTREQVPLLRRGLGELERLLNENPIVKGRMVGVGYLDLTGCVALGMTGPVLRSTGLPHDLRRAAPYCGYEGYDFDIVTWDTCDAYGRLRVRLEEMYQSLRIIEQCCDKLDATAGQPVMVADKKIAWPAQLSVSSDGQGNSLEHIREIMGTSMESLIHHFKLVTEGFRVPPGQVYVAVESAKGELGCHAVADGGTRPYRVHFRDPSFNNLQATSLMCEGGQVADVIVAVASIDPVMGGVDR